MRVLITGVAGQDGAYLARLLLDRGYTVYGAYRRNSAPHLERLDALGIRERVRLVPFDLLETSNLLRLLADVRPSELFHLAAQRFVPLSFDLPVYTAQVDAVGTAALLEAVRTVVPCCRFYQASTSEMFGTVSACPQNERTPLRPRSPYAAAKAYAHWMTGLYRDAHGLHASCGILFNHESPLRGADFVTRKVTLGLARISHGSGEILHLGNLDARRDWGFAGDYMRGVEMMMESPDPDDYVLATGEMHTVRDWVQCAADAAGFHLAWEGEALQEHAIDRRTGKTVVEIDPGLFRPAEVAVLQGDAAKARSALGWHPTVGFEDLVQLMVGSDMDRVAGRPRAAPRVPR